jgi:hypothetical protein
MKAVRALAALALALSLSLSAAPTFAQAPTEPKVRMFINLS